MSLPIFSTPKDLCIYLENHNYIIGSKNFIRAVKNKNAGLMLEELVVRLCRSRKTKDTAVVKINDKIWVDISDSVLKHDCFLTQGEINAARQFLQKKGFLEVKNLTTVFRYSVNGNLLITALNQTQQTSSPLLTASKETNSDSLSNTTKFESPIKIYPSSSRGTRIPNDFSVSFEMRVWARQRYPDLDLDDITESFVDYWKAIPGTKGIKLDWEATWRNWIRNTWPKRSAMSGSEKTKQPKNGWYTGDDVGFIN